ncbi:YceI family protein [Arenibacter sp. 6A1]|uniref:YceI family protein n=1 Tax=Arenibacter sp. 6A1 TaxID=2720391 RepID=UPI00144791D7|nr:YceI family protein [Arenibacter sp. 6A1]NKI27614.1 YceI family protein [Arenibacter sp. 6A1]
MKTFFKVILCFLLLLGPAVITAQEQLAKQWELDPHHTSVNFGVKHFFNTVNGIFQEKEGTFNFDESDLANSKFTFKVAVASIDTNNEKRDKHLRSEDFFNAAMYEYITFSSNKIEKTEGNNYQVTGDLTIKDVTKTVTIPFQVTGEMEHPMMEGTLIKGLSFNTSLNRTDYGVGTGDWGMTMVVGDKVNIEINMELNRKM